MSDDVTITVRVSDGTAAGFRDVNGRVRDMQGRFATASGDMQRSSARTSASLDGMRASLLSLAPAAVPVAASLAPIAVQAGAAGLAVAAFGAAVIPQIANLGEASKAQTKYSDAVRQYGAHSSQATQAQVAAQQTLKSMPVATQRAAAGYSSLKDTFQNFSDSTARFTMAPVEHSFAVLGQIVPKLAPMAEGTATQLDRLVKVGGGAVNTSGFDTLSKKVSDFANQALKGATDKAISFARALSEGNAHGPIASFMEYAKAQGPAVKELISNIAEAVSNLLEGASQAGPGLLTLVNAMAKLVASVPPELVGTLMQVYAAFKLIRLAGAGVGAIAGGFATLGTKIAALRAASVAAGGGLAGMNAALNTLGTGGKAALALGAVGALVLALHQLSDNKAPVAVDELSTSLNTLAATGKVTGALKTNFTEMSKSIAMVSKGASDNKIATMVSDFGSWIGIATGPGISDAKKGLDSWDKSMANLVRGGKPKEAAAQFEILKRGWVASGGDLKRLKETTNDYQNALADQAFEQKMAAESMGLFGAAAQKAQASLAAQKASADGLRQSIQALNDVQRAGLGGMIGFEGAIDAAAKAAKDNAGALSMTHGVLDLNSEKARNAASALQDLATKTDDAASSARESGSSWETVNGIYSRGRDKLIESARAMGLNKTEAAQLADQILKIPDKSVKFKMNDEDARAGLNAFNAAVKRSPGTKKVTLQTLSSSAEHALEAFGFKVTHLKDGSVRVTAKTGGALSGIRNVAGAVASLHDKTISITSIHNVITNSKTFRSVHDITGATGGLYTGKAFRYADGGPVRGPGTGTSDDVPAPWLSNGEFVIKKASVDKYGEKFLQRLNDGQVDAPRYAKGGKVTDAMKQARSDLRGQTSISAFGRAAGYQRTELAKGLGAPADLGALVSSLNGLRGDIKGAFSGRAESRLLKQLDSVGRSLIKYDKQLNAVNKSLDTAKSKLSDLKGAASSLASSVKSGVLNSANITRGASGDGPVTTASIMGGLTASRDKATAFAGALKQLKAKGLSKSLIQQIAESGIEGGGLETAGALLGASGSEVKSLNDLQKQIGGAAGSAGKTTADSVYGAAIKAQTATVHRLQKSQDRLEKTMAHLAKVMEKSVAHAVGKKAAGGIVGAAAAGGMRGGLTWVGEHEPELLDLPAGSRVWSGPDSRRKAQAPWASMLNTPRRPASTSASPPAAGGGPSRPIVIQLAIGKQQFGEVWVDVGREQVRARGSIEATLKPPRGR